MTRKQGSYCLRLPLRMVRLRIRVDGYHPCAHSIPTKTTSLTWSLKEEKDGDLLDDTYRCAAFSR